MKAKYIFLPALASMMLVACDDQIMDWERPENEHPITSSEIPLMLREKIANYNYIKAYSQQYMPNVKIGIGLGADNYLDSENPAYAQICNDNFEQFVTGNAMKHQSVVQSNGSLNLTNVKAFLEKVPEDIEVYGHNFIWHTQQQQNYLKSLIAPKLVVESTSDIQTMLAGDAANFDGGTTGGWGSWGSNKESADVVDGAGPDGSKALVLVNKGDGSAWEAQCAYTFGSPLDMTKEYTLRFKAKSTTGAGYLQFQYQNGTTYGSQGGYHDFAVGTDWTTCECSFTPSADDVDRIIINFGKVGGSYTIDDIEFGVKVEDPMETMLAGDAYDFEGGTTGGWGSWGSNKESADVKDGMGYDNSKGLVLVNKGDGSAWEAQNAYTFDAPLDATKSYIIQFWAKSSSPAGYLQFQYQNGTTYGSQGGYHDFTVGTDWIQCEFEFTPSADDVDRIIINFGKVGATYQIDNIKFGPAKNQSKAAVKARQKAASKSYYVLKTPEEKRTALLGAMEEWIKGMAEATKGKIKQWDVVNEPISDGGGWRGIDGVFGSEGDSEPTETEADGLNLNWENGAGNGHFYWGYYIGKDYAAKAFEYARKYVGDDAKLYVNDYNLETNPAKLAELIKFVEYIDAHGAKVDGIGTQMHVQKSITKEKVDAMFKTMAATGKLVRISELDVAMGAASLDEALQQQQSDIYQMIVTSYKENVPEAQQGGICIWGLSDAANEHEYWLNGDAPNLFDGNYARKIAYKGVCDGIAGKDISEEFNGDMWEKYYENK